jgi:hypothetical protein
MVLNRGNRRVSYDFSLFLPQPGVDPLVTAQRLADAEWDDANPGPPLPAKEARKRAIADALTEVDPSLNVVQFGFEEIAKLQNISLENARTRFRHLELDGPEHGPGIQIALFDDSGSLTVPYWHKDTRAKDVFAKIWQYLKVIQEVAGYQIYDPQMECIIDLGSDLDRATERYTDVVKRVIG